ncbi:MAG: helix-turn-helix transcriptional regulator, partial [Firmicutes bacterium]|nr:helix-turn-helix transcriptional regulator [Bacillota bacterium]
MLEALNKLGSLSPRESQVIRLMAEGQTASEIAGTMGISSETVKTHRKKIYKKLGVNKKSDYLRKARELGLLDAHKKTKSAPPGHFRHIKLTDFKSPVLFAFPVLPK